MNAIHRHIEKFEIVIEKDDENEWSKVVDILGNGGYKFSIKRGCPLERNDGTYDTSKAHIVAERITEENTNFNLPLNDKYAYGIRNNTSETKVPLLSIHTGGKFFQL